MSQKAAPDKTVDHKIIDARGLRCPQPLLMVRSETAGLKHGASVHVVADDPHADLDLEVWCHRHGHQLTTADFEQGVWRFELSINRP